MTAATYPSGKHPERTVSVSEEASPEEKALWEVAQQLKAQQEKVRSDRAIRASSPFANQIL